MNTIKIYLAESGRIADLSKDFPLFKGQFNDKLLNVYVPTSILAPQFDIQHYIGQMSLAEIPSGQAALNALLNAFVVSSTPTGRDAMVGDIIEVFDSTANNYYLYTYGGTNWTGTEVDSFGTFTTLAGTSVKLGLIATKRNGTMYESKSYFMRYLKTLTYEGKEYALYERKLPKEFTSFVGTSTIIANVVNVDTQSKQITSLVTSQSCELEVFQSTMLDQDEPIEASDMENLQAALQSIDEQLPLKQDKNDESISTNSVVTTQNVVGAINEISAQTAVNTSNISTNSYNIAGIQTEQTEQNSRIQANETNIGTNTGDISNLDTRVSRLEQQSGVEETYIGTMEGSSLPTEAQLNDFVLDTAHRAQKGGDVIVFIQQIPNATDKVFKYTYSAVSQHWSSYEIPSTEPASNTSKGIVQGSYTNDSTNPTQVNIVGGNINGIYVVDNNSNKREIAEYLNTSATGLSNVTTKANLNEQNIAGNTAQIAQNSLDITHIVNGDTVVAKATSAEKDGINRNIAQTYMTQSAGATKQELYEYALPRTFNDVSFLNENNIFNENLPTDPNPIYSETSTSIGYTELLYASKTISNAEFDLSNKNSYTTTFWVSASADCGVVFRLLTEIYINGEWITLNTELTDTISLVENEIQKIPFASSFNSLTDVLNVSSGDIIKQTLEVQTQVSAALVFSVYSNTIYPSTFNLNTTSQTIILSQGKLGELPVLQLYATPTSGQLTFVLPDTFDLNNKVEALFVLSTLNAVASTTSIQLLKGVQTIPIYTPANYGTNTTATASILSPKFANNINKWVFSGTFIQDNGDWYLLADVDNIVDYFDNYYTKSQIDSALGEKQNNLSTAQLNAVNSGITSAGVTQIGTNTANISANASNITTLQSTTASIQSQTTTNTSSISALNTRVGTAENDITTINGKIPVQASSSNQLADKAFVNSTVQTATANFRGSWATWSDVPTSASSYPQDAQGSTTPTSNDYIVVQDASGYTEQTLDGTWRFKYVGVWATDGKAGWLPEYQVNETPLTQAQLDALNSGATTTNIGQIATNTTNISNNTTAIGQNTSAISGLTTRMGTAENNISAIPNNYVAYTSTQSLSDAQKTTARSNIGAGTSNFSGSYDNLSNKPALKTDNTTAQSTSASETITGTINLHKVAKTGTASDLIGYSDLALASSVTNLASTVGDNTTAINTINGKIPSEASSTNQLADKSYVNSSIATSTATFRGTYNLVSDLSLTTSATHTDIGTALGTAISTADANDYCFVKIPTADATPTQIASVERYKYSSGWAYEYTLNNSGFTSAQWEAINSGATTTNISQIATNTSNITSLGSNKVDKTTTVNGKALSSNISLTASDVGAVSTTNGVTNVSYDSSSKKLQQTKNGSASDVVTFGANAFTDTTIPTATSQLTNDSGFLTDHQSIKTLKTNNTTAQATSSSEAITGSGTINLHKVAKTGTYSDLIGAPTIPTKDSDLTNDRYVRYDTASQGLSSTQQSNARTNIGAGTSNFDGAYSSLSGKPTLGTASALDTGTSQGNIPVLGTDGKLPSSVVPASAITDTFVASSQTAMLALSGAEVGDICVRTDINKTFILKAEPYSTLANWQELLTPTEAVTSVNSQTGAVVLTASDVGAVPTTRTVNSKALSSDITLTYTDVGAEAAFNKNTAFNRNFETSTSDIKMNGTVSVGSSNNIARADHVHPSDTSKIDKSSTAQQIYGTDGSGNQTTLSYSKNGTANSIVQRDSTGAITIGEPRGTSDATTKSYVDTIANDIVKCSEVTGTIDGYGSSVSLTASIPSGYKFLCWLQPATSGWVGSVYPEFVYNSTTNFWNASTDNGHGVIKCGYLVIKDV